MINECKHPLYFRIVEDDGFAVDICVVCEEEFPVFEEVEQTSTSREEGSHD